MRLAPYPKYKPSGVEWLGEVPEHWDVKPLGRLVRFAGGATPDKGKPEYWDGDIPWVSPKDMKRMRIADVPDHISAEALSSSPLTLLPVKSVLIVVRGMILAHSFPVAITDVAATINQDMKAIAAGKQLDAEFVLWSLTGVARVFVSLADESAHGTRKLESEIVARVRLALPPMTEQVSIADFLDHETAKIDTLVAKKRTLIERLKEKRTALISRTVTRGLPPDAARAAGLDPHPKLKPSGIDWLGDVPEHWTLKRVGDELEFISYGFTNPMPTTDEGPFMVTANDINGGRVLFETARCTLPEDFEKLTRKSKPWRRDILVTKDGTLGRVAVVDSEYPFCINQSVALLRPRPSTNERFLGRSLQSPPYFDRMVFDAGGTTIKHIYITRLARMPIAAPPAAEQVAISDFLDRETAKTDEMVAKVGTAVERLQEYRTALITAAVTGKIDVRNADVVTVGARP